MGEKKEALEDWLRALHDEGLDIDDDTDLAGSGVVTSIQFVSMVVEIERIQGAPLEPAMIDTATLRSIGSIDRHVFGGA